MLNASDYARLYSEEYGVSLETAAEECAKHWKLLGRVLFKDGLGLSVYKIGVFKQVLTAPKKFKHPATGELLIRPAKRVIKFKQSDSPFI